jgi:hypothetical protein
VQGSDPPRNLVSLLVRKVPAAEALPRKINIFLSAIEVSFGAGLVSRSETGVNRGQWGRQSSGAHAGCSPTNLFAATISIREIGLHDRDGFVRQIFRNRLDAVCTAVDPDALACPVMPVLSISVPFRASWLPPEIELDRACHRALTFGHWHRPETVSLT